VAVTPEGTYGERCGRCHELISPRIPHRTALQKMPAKRILRSLDFGASLPPILAAGYRVRSPRGTQFRQWATARLEEYLVKGFTMDDGRLKQAGGGGYFDELLERIRDIRSSERVFWRKVLDICSTIVDCDPSTEASQKSFAVVQNKTHWRHMARRLLRSSNGGRMRSGPTWDLNYGPERHRSAPTSGRQSFTSGALMGTPRRL